MLGSLSAGINAILTFFQTIGEALVHFFDTLVSFFGYITSAVGFMTSAVQLLPAPLIAFAVACISLSVLFLVLGR